jgi:hypothetical protein
MNQVAADERRLTHSRAKKVRASSRRLPRFKDSRRDDFFLGSLILTVDRVRNPLKPELPTASGTTPRGFEFRLLAVSGQDETTSAWNPVGRRGPVTDGLPSEWGME